MFVLKTDHRYTWPVDVKVPQDGGKHATKRFTAEFEILPQNEIDALLKDTARDESFDVDVMERVLVGWSDVQDEDGNDIAFNDESMAALIGISYVRLALSSAYFDSIRGQAARRKNSKRPRA